MELDPNVHRCGDDIIQLIKEMWSEAPDSRPIMRDVVTNLGLRTGDQFGQSSEGHRGRQNNNWGRGIQVIDPTFSKEDVHDWIETKVIKSSLDSSQNHVSKLLAGVRQFVEDHDDLEDNERLTPILLDAFKISKATLTPERNVSLKPFVLLFDEYYTDLYRMSEAEDWMHDAQRIVFMGTSFSVNITSIALRTALSNEAAIEVVDPQPIDLGYERIEYHKMTAADYVSDRSE